jgi:hypothetical protein
MVTVGPAPIRSLVGKSNSHNRIGLPLAAEEIQPSDGENWCPHFEDTSCLLPGQHSNSIGEVRNVQVGAGAFARVDPQVPAPTPVGGKRTVWVSNCARMSIARKGLGGRA